MANFTSVHTGATIDASVTIISGSGVTQSDLTKLNAVTSSAVELNILDGVTASTAEINILDGLTASTTELNYLDGADSSITTLSLPDNTTITTFGASLIDDADAATARTTLGVDVAGTDNSTDVTLVTTSHDYLSLSGQAITLGQIDISDDTNLVGGDGLALTGDTLSVNVDDSSIEINSDTLRVKASGVTNAMLAGSIANAKLSNSSVSYGGVSVALGSSDATPAFDLSDATSLPIVAGTTGTLSVARGGTGATTASGARTNLNVDVAGTDNSTDVTLVTTSHDYLSLSGQAVTLGQIDISDDTNLVGGTGITLTGDTLSTTDSEIVHDDLSGFVSNEHIDHSTVSISAGTGLSGGGDLTSTRTLSTNDSEIVHDNLSGFVSNEHIDHSSVSITAGTGLSGGGDITTSRTLTTDDSAIVHDNLSGFVSNEHIDHSGVSITAGAGLTGGGDITSTRDIAVGAGTGVTVNADDIAIGQDVATSADVEFNSVTADIIGDIRGATKFTAKADVALNKGDAVYISGVSGNTPTVDIADANDASKMPSFGLAGSSVSINGSVEIFTFGTLPGLNTSSFSVGDILYVSTNGTSGNTLTATKPTGESSLLQNIGTVQRSHASAGSIKVGGAGRTNATPNLDDGDIFIGNGSNQAVSASLNAKIESYLDGGTSTANFDTISVDGVEITATPAELNKMDGVTSTTAELNYTDGVTSNIQTQLDLKAPLASPGFSGTATGVNLTLSGDLTVNGSTTTLDTTNIAVEDNLMELNSGVTSNANDAGIIIERGSTGDNAIFMWDESADKFTLGTTSANADSTGNIAITTGTLVASSFEGAVTGDVTGNADTATTLATARNFSLTGDVTAGAVSFDGSGNVALATTIAANSVALGTDTTGNYMSDLTEGTGIDITHTPAEGSNGTIALDLTEVGFGGGANRLITDDGDGTVSTEANLTFDGSTLALTGDLNVGSGDFFVDDSAGSVGIGTSSPATKLHIQNGSSGFASSYNSRTNAVIEGSSAFGSVLSIMSKNTGYSGIFFGDQDSESIGQLVYDHTDNKFKFRTAGGVQTPLTLDSSGNVGIGTTSPESKLNIVDSGETIIKLYASTASTRSGIWFTNGSYSYGTNIGTDNKFHITGNINSEGELVTVDSSGNVGIGTDSPEVDLHIVDSIYSQLKVETSGAGNVEIETQANDNSDEAFFGTRSNHDLKFRTNWTNAMTIDTSQNVGIGTNSPSTKLHIQGSAVSGSSSDANSLLTLTNNANNSIQINSSTTANGQIRFGDADSNFRGAMTYYHSSNILGFTTSGVERVRIDATGTKFSENFSSTDDVLHINPANGHNRTMELAGDAINVTVTGGGSNTLKLNEDGGDVDICNGDLYIDESANAVGIGTQSPDSKLQVEYTTTSNGSAAIAEFGTSGSGSIAGSAHQVIVGGPSVSDYTGIQIFSDTTTGKGVLSFADGRGANDNWRGVIQYDHSANDMEFWTDAAERMKIDASGNVAIGNTSPTQKLDMNGKLKMRDTSIPSEGEASSAMFFCNSGEMRVIDASGNITVLSPHNFSLIPGGASEDRAWGYYSEKNTVDDEGNVTTTQKVNVDMMKLARLVEELTGEKLVYTEED